MKKIVLFLMILMLEGCFFATPNSTFYLLESTNTASSISKKKINIAVYDITLPDYLQKPQIVLQKSDSPELQVSEFNRWASDLESMIQNTLIEDLQTIMPQSTIKPLLYGSNAQYIIKVNIEKMSGYFGQDAVLRGVYQILTPSNKVIKQSDFEFKTPAGRKYADYAKAQSRLLADLALMISKAI